MQSRIRNGRTRKEMNSEPILVNLETGGKREVMCVLESSNRNNRELNGYLYQGRKHWLVRWHRSASSGSGHNVELMQGKMLSGVNTGGETSSTWHRKADAWERHRSNDQREMRSERPTCHRVRFKDGLTENRVQV